MAAFKAWQSPPLVSIPILFIYTTSNTFYRKKTGVSDFTREEIKRIKEVLHLSAEEVDAIFFGD
jgi:hypothetical protein